MKISTGGTYHIYEDSKIKEFVVTDMRDGEVVSGYIKGEGSVQLRGVDWLQEDPEKLKKRYKAAMRYYKKNGNKRVKTLKADFPGLSNEKIDRKVVITKIYINPYCNKNGATAHFITNKGIVYAADLAWFEEEFNDVVECGVRLIDEHFMGTMDMYTMQL